MTIKTLAAKGVSQSEIARMLGVTEGAVRYQVKRMQADAVDGRSRHPPRPTACAPDNRPGDSRSYRAGFGEHLGTKLRRQIAGRQQVDAKSKQRFQLHLKTAQIKQRCTRQGID